MVFGRVVLFIFVLCSNFFVSGKNATLHHHIIIFRLILLLKAAFSEVVVLEVHDYEYLPSFNHPFMHVKNHLYFIYVLNFASMF